MSDKIHIALVANDRYRPGLECTKVSMLRACATPDRLVFHEYGDKDMEPFLAQMESDLRDFYGTGSKLTYLRLFLPALLPDCDWVLYADVDTLWFRDPCELWELRDESKSVCWVRDLEVAQIETGWWAKEKGIPNVRKDKYACAGIALINLKRWRETDFIGRMRAFLKAHGCPLHHDQDIMNFLLEDDSRMIGEEWNTMIPPRKWRPCVLHITGIGRRLNGADHYDGSIPQYIYWFNYWRQYLLRLPKMNLPWRLRVRCALLVLLSWTIGPLLDLADKLPGGYAWKMAIMRLRRQLGWARLALGFCPASR